MKWLGEGFEALDVRLNIIRSNVSVTRVNDLAQRHAKIQRGLYGFVLHLETFGYKVSLDECQAPEPLLRKLPRLLRWLSLDQLVAFTSWQTRIAPVAFLA